MEELRDCFLLKITELLNLLINTSTTKYHFVSLSSFDNFASITNPW